MKQSKKHWALTAKQKRKDGTKPPNGYERWCRTPGETTESHGTRRRINKESIRKIIYKGMLEDEVYFPYKWQYFRDYYY